MNAERTGLHKQNAAHVDSGSTPIRVGVSGAESASVTIAPVTNDLVSDEVNALRRVRLRAAV